MMKRSGDPWISADEYGKSLEGLSVNLLVPDIQPCCKFAEIVLEAEVVYKDEDFAALQLGQMNWMLHADHTYRDHPMSGVIEGATTRGIGIELRVHSMNPDNAESRARNGGYHILDGATDKPHGLREVFIVDPVGYIWVIDDKLKN